MTETTETTEILDAIRDSLANRNREKDNELAMWWAGWLEGHAGQLRTISHRQFVARKEQADDSDTP